MFRQKVKISSLFTDELFTAKVGEEAEKAYQRLRDKYARAKKARKCQRKCDHNCT